MWVVVIDPHNINEQPFILGDFSTADIAAEFAGKLEDLCNGLVRTSITYLTSMSFWWMKVHRVAPFV